MRNAAATTAFCTLGPTMFHESGGDYDGMMERLKIAARDWREEGPEAQVDTMIIKTLDDAGLLSDDFAECFNELL